MSRTRWFEEAIETGECPIKPNPQAAPTPTKPPVSFGALFGQQLQDVIMFLAKFQNKADDYTEEGLIRRFARLGRGKSLNAANVRSAVEWFLRKLMTANNSPLTRLNEGLIGKCATAAATGKSGRQASPISSAQGPKYAYGYNPMTAAAPRSTYSPPPTPLMQLRDSYQVPEDPDTPLDQVAQLIKSLDCSKPAIAAGVLELLNACRLKRSTRLPFSECREVRKALSTLFKSDSFILRLDSGRQREFHNEANFWWNPTGRDKLLKQ